VIICELIVHLLVTVQNKRILAYVDSPFSWYRGSFRRV